ncbi:MAG: IclR family transcriptional regulator [Rhodobacteraceae bacterium]|nr:IclR family transcriptional regulator [Paracoccaceae bacterium]
MQAPQKPRGRPKAADVDQTIIQSLDRALDILAELSRADSVSLTELSLITRQSPSTVYRVLSTFARHGMAEADANQQWRIGPGAFRIGSRFLRQSNLLDASRPIMRDLMQSTQETANLGIDDNGQVLFLSQTETSQTIRAFFPPGTRNPLHSSGIGKAILAWYAPERVAAIVANHGLKRFTDTTITDPDDLSEDLARARQKGYAFDNEERTNGMRCIAAPVFDPFGEPVAGLSVSGPGFRIPPNAVSEIGAKVRAAANELSKAIGGESPAGQN